MLILFNPACFSIVMLILPFLNCTNHVYSSKLKMRYQGENNLLTVISFFFSLKGGGVVLRIKYTV